MKMLLIHADLIEYWTTRKTKIAEEGKSDHGKHEDVTVAFMAVEPGDREKLEEITASIKKVIAMQHSKSLFLYPYAHLSENLSSPKEAVEVLDKVSSEMKCDRAPFGWYKKFHLHAKGHPMSEFSRQI